MRIEELEFYFRLMNRYVQKYEAYNDRYAFCIMQAGQGAGLGLFISDTATGKQLKPCMASSRSWWWWPIGGGGGGSPQKQLSLASFPLSSAITAANILRSPELGSGYGWMLERGLVDERTIIMAHLVTERLKGQSSALAPWIEALPKTYVRFCKMGGLHCPLVQYLVENEFGMSLSACHD